MYTQHSDTTLQLRAWGWNIQRGQAIWERGAWVRIWLMTRGRDWEGLDIMSELPSVYMYEKEY